MRTAFLLDENLRGILMGHILRHNMRGDDVIDAIQVGDLEELPLGTLDPEILEWCERNGRILVSNDRNTIAVHLSKHLRNGGGCPGIFLIRRRPIREIVDFLAMATHASEPGDWQNQIHYIP